MLAFLEAAALFKIVLAWRFTRSLYSTLVLDVFVLSANPRATLRVPLGVYTKYLLLLGLANCIDSIEVEECSKFNSSRSFTLSGKARHAPHIYAGHNLQHDGYLDVVS